MKKIIALCFCLAVVGPLRPAFADNAPPSLNLTDQVTAALTQHATFAIEYRHGSKSLILSDNVVEIGKLKGDYVASLDLGLNGATLPNQSQQAIEFTSGLRLNVSTLVKNFVPLKQEWTFLNHFEYYGRGFYDWARKAWYGSLNVGYGFGPGTAQ